MGVQLIQNAKGENTGVYIPMNDWEIIKAELPNMGEYEEVPEWQQKIVLERLEEIKKNPKILEPIENFFD